MCNLGIYVDCSGNSIAEAIGRVEAGAVDINTLGGKLRAKAIAELDCQKVGEKLSGMYSEISRAAQGQRPH
jgi:hypothetical protein